MSLVVAVVHSFMVDNEGFFTVFEGGRVIRLVKPGTVATLDLFVVGAILCIVGD